MAAKIRMDRHVLYEASVQAVEVDIALIERIYRRWNGRRPRTLREDFCGTALLACEWVASRPDREAWGVDLDADILQWSLRERAPVLGDDAERLHLLQEDVLSAPTPTTEVITALNFSYMIFRERQQMLRYFRSVCEKLPTGGLFLLDKFGGPHAEQVMSETKNVPAGVDFAGRLHPPFTYVWEQASFNAVNREMSCYIHFRGKRIHPQRRAFRYSWRLWTITEIKDLLLEAGFDTVEHYFEGWDDQKECTDGVLRPRTRVEDMDAWIAYLAARRGPPRNI